MADALSKLLDQVRANDQLRTRDETTTQGSDEFRDDPEHGTRKVKTTVIEHVDGRVLGGVNADEWNADTVKNLRRTIRNATGIELD